MGLASSQARLLTLTGRQHSVEFRAQRIMADKLRLANDSDRVYQQYINALDDTQLKTQWTNQHGAVTWVNGSINNLLRYGADEDTAGTTFLVQDLSSGKLYIPAEIGEAYDSATSAEEFAESFGVTYKQVDLNEDIVTNYNKVLSKGYDKLLGADDEECANVYNQYIIASNKDSSIQNKARAVLGALQKNDEGVYIGTGDYGNLANRFQNAIEEIESSSDYESIYSIQSRNIINKAKELLTTIDTNIPIGEITGIYSSYSILYGLYTWQETKYNGTLSVKTAETEDSSSKEYINIEDPTTSDIDNSIIYSIMLNGGEINYVGKKNVWRYVTETDNENAERKNLTQTVTNNEEIRSSNAYDSLTYGYIASYNGANQTSVTNLGDALRNIFTKISKYNQNETDFLTSKNLTKDDIEHYEEYIIAKSNYEDYRPDYTWIPDNQTKATYYENIFKSIKTAGGWIEAGAERAKSDSWVGNMIKSNQVILTVWDTETETLSKTAAELNTKIREITDENKVEQVSQDYEAEMAIINKKDKDFDTKLSKLETERTAITTELEGIKQVMKNNVDVTFKLFS